MDKFGKKLTPEQIGELVDIIARGNKAKFGRKLNVTGEAVNRWLKGISEPSKMKMEALLEMRRALEDRKYPEAKPGEGVSIIQESFNDISDYVEVPLVEGRVAAGPNGTIVEDVIEDYYPFKHQWVERRFGRGKPRKELVLIRAWGDSMSPTINSGELVLVDQGMGERLSVNNGKIYLIRLVDGESLALKRVVASGKDAPKLVCLSDNPAYAPFEIEIEPGKELSYYLIGRIRWAGKEFD